MARRRPKQATSAAGWGVLIFVGIAVAIVNAASRFVQENRDFVLGAFLVGGIGLLIFLIFKAFKRRSRIDPFNSAVDLTRGVEKLEPSPAQARREPSFEARQSRSRSTAARWIQSGEAVKVQGFNLSAGLFYFGEYAPGGSNNHREQYVINPRLAIATKAMDIEGSSMPYWPSYASIVPNARAAFLQWMADGRCDPTRGIGYVFLFFYGLEHRLFKEGARGDARVLIAEVTRLLSIYGQNGSFRHYAEKFLFAARVFGGVALDVPRPTAERNETPEIADSVRLYIGKLLATSDSLTADVALVWVLAIPDTYLRTPALRCFDEFVVLWRMRFVQKYPDGLKVKDPKKALRLRYRAASGAFEVDLLSKDEIFPDIATIQTPIKGLKALVQSCTDELDSYSRFIGRQPNRKATVQAALLLPFDLRLSAEVDPMVRLRGRLGELLGTRVSANMPTRKLLQLADFEVPENGKLATAESDQLSQALDRIGFAIEPDRRYGGWVPQPDDEIVIFKADRGGPIDPDRPVYRRTKAQVEVAVLAATADGTPSGEDFESVKNTINAATDFSVIERVRLLAYAVTLFRSPPKQERVLRRLNERTPAERGAIASAAVAAIGSDGRVDAAQVRFLEKLHKSLGLPRERVYSELHRAAVVVDEPIAISTEHRVAGIPIPKRPAIAIDPSRLERVRKDTDAVSKLLTQIFSESAAPQYNSQPIDINGASPRSSLDGLDPAHAELVEAMEARGEMARKEFEQRARALKLLPDGAIETINEWAFDHFEEPLLEDGDRVVLVAHLRDSVAQLRETAS